MRGGIPVRLPTIDLSPLHRSTSPTARLPRNVKLLGLASLLNDIASEMAYPLLPAFLIGVLGGNRVHLGLIEGVAESTASLLKLWSGGRSDRAGRRKGFVVFGYALATEAWHVWALFLGYAAFYALTEPAEKALIADLVGGERKGLAFGWYNFAIGIAALPSSLIFGALYESFGALAAFGWGAALALVAALMLAGVRRDGTAAVVSGA